MVVLVLDLDVVLVWVYLDHLSPLDDLAAVEDRWTVQRVVGSSRHNVRPLRIGQVPEPEQNHIMGYTGLRVLKVQILQV